MQSSLVRAATLDDAPGAVHVLRESITHLCRDDRRDEPTSLGRWLPAEHAFGAVWHFPYAKRLPPERPLGRAR